MSSTWGVKSGFDPFEPAVLQCLFDEQRDVRIPTPFESAGLQRTKQRTSGEDALSRRLTERRALARVCGARSARRAPLDICPCVSQQPFSPGFDAGVRSAQPGMHPHFRGHTGGRSLTYNRISIREATIHLSRVKRPGKGLRKRKKRL